MSERANSAHKSNKSRDGDRTTLQNRAASVVNDIDDEEPVQVNDEQKYDEMVESRKDRRAVSLNSILNLPFLDVIVCKG